MTADEVRVAKIFMPYAMSQLERIKAQNTRFVHYTTAEAAINILRNRGVWMRKSSCMNDYMEVQHGLNCLLAAYRSPAGQEFKASLNALHEGVIGDIEQLFNGWTPHFSTATFFTCISEHDDAEDICGRLSMWRAYGDGKGIALVTRNSLFQGASSPIKIYSSPVAYLDDKDFANQLSRVADNIRSESEFLRSMSREFIVAATFNALRFGALCAKHRGFREEREWRIIYAPTFEQSDHLVREIRVIGGVPQPIYSIPLRDIPDANYVGASIPALLDRIIIGPTKFPAVIYDAFLEVLTDANVDTPEQKIFVSDIPLRS